MVRENFAPSSSDADDDEDESSDECIVILEAVASFNSGTMHRVSLSSSCSSHKRKRLSSIKKNCVSEEGYGREK